MLFRSPEAIVSTRMVKLTASKLGERLSQTVTVRNKVPETVLTGWWEVAPHPSDLPHTPHAHEWISFNPRKFEGNNNQCSIVVKTDKLMAEKVYKRQILLHSNSSEVIEELNLIIRTAEVPIKADKLNYYKLNVLLIKISPLLSIALVLTFYLYMTGKWLLCIVILSVVSMALIVNHPNIKYRKLVKKYRDSEEGLIKP